MNNNFQGEVKGNYYLGDLIHGKVERHFLLGVFVNISDENVKVTL